MVCHTHSSLSHALRESRRAALECNTTTAEARRERLGGLNDLESDEALHNEKIPTGHDSSHVPDISQRFFGSMDRT